MKGLRFGLAMVSILGLLYPAPALAGNDLGLSAGPVELIGGATSVSYRAETPFTPRLEETLRRGMPATVTFQVGLWKRRTFWFDKLVLAVKSEHRVIYDPWGQVFRVRSGSAKKSQSVENLEALQALLFSERKLPLVAAASLDPDGRYYVSVRATIRPLSEEDLDEIEDWLSGEVKKSPEKPERGVPAYLRGIAVSMSGLGDRTALAKSETFRPSLLEAPQ